MSTKMILLEHGKKREMMRLLKVTYPTIKKALMGAEETALQKRIRAYALRNGGVEVEMIKKRNNI